MEIDNRLPILDLELFGFEEGMKDSTGFDKIAYVDEPAIEQKGILLSKETQESLYKLSLQLTEKQQVLSPLLIPDILIYRRNKEIGEFYIRAKSEVIKDIRLKAKQDGKLDDLNIFKDTHKGETAKAFILEEWIIESEDDKTYTEYGFSSEDIPLGTWMVHSQVVDNEYWKDIKDNNKNAYSIEAFLNMKLVELTSDVYQKIKNKKDNMKDEIETLKTELETMKNLITELKKDKEVEAVEEEDEVVEDEKVEAIEDEEEDEVVEDEKVEAIEDEEEDEVVEDEKVEAIEDEDEDEDEDEEGEIADPSEEEHTDIEKNFETIYEEIASIKSMISDLNNSEDEEDNVETKLTKAQSLNALTRIKIK